MSGALVRIDRERAHASLHALSQPLTVMSLALSLVQNSTSESERAQALEAVMTECDRAMRSVFQLRSLLEEGVESAACLRDKEGDGTRADWMFGGMA